MPVPISLASLPRESRLLSLDLADNVLPCLSGFQPSFLELIASVPGKRAFRPTSGHSWSWERSIPPDAPLALPGEACSSGGTTKSIPAGVTEDSGRLDILYSPCESHAWLAEQDLTHVVTLDALRVGLNTSAHIKCADVTHPNTGKIAGSLTYVSKMWPRDQIESWVGFCSELVLYKSERYLRPLQGSVVPRMLGVYNTDSGFTFNMEPPHPVFWFEACATMPEVLKAKVVSAYSAIHARGILHGDVALRHMLIGADARVTIIDFQESRALVPDDAVGLVAASADDIALEMRRVRFVLDFESAREYERAKTERERKRRRTRTTKAAPPISDDVMAPCIHPEQLREWQEGCRTHSKRVIMPGIDGEQLRASVSEFINILKGMLDGDESWSLCSDSGASSSSSPVTPRLPERPMPAPPSDAVELHGSWKTLATFAPKDAVEEGSWSDADSNDISTLASNERFSSPSYLPKPSSPSREVDTSHTELTPILHPVIWDSIVEPRRSLASDELRERPSGSLSPTFSSAAPTKKDGLGVDEHTHIQTTDVFTSPGRKRRRDSEDEECSAKEDSSPSKRLKNSGRCSQPFDAVSVHSCLVLECGPSPKLVEPHNCPELSLSRRSPSPFARSRSCSPSPRMTLHILNVP